MEQGQDQGRFGGNAWWAQYVHLTRSFMAFAAYQGIDPGFRADSGFVPRADTRMIDLETDIFLYGVRGGGKRGRWFDRLHFWVRGYRTEDHTGRLTDSRVALGGTYDGPWQSVMTFIARWNQEFYSGCLYDVSDLVLIAGFNPASGLQFGLEGNLARAVDYANARPALAFRLGPSAEFGLGRHINFGASYLLERLNRDEGRLYTAHLLQGRLIFNVNTRCFLRAIAQFRDVDRDPSLYNDPVEPRSRGLFTQLLFSYKINAQTVLFLGYSDDSIGTREIDLTRTGRTFFLKIGYALVL